MLPNFSYLCLPMATQLSPIEALKQQKLLLRIAYEAEKESYRKQALAAGPARMVKRGEARWPVRAGRFGYNSLNLPVIDIVRGAEDDDDHRFEPGRPVVLFAWDKDAGRPMKDCCEGTVSYVEGPRMVVVLPNEQAGAVLQAVEKGLGVRLAFDETSYRLMFEALDKAINARNNRLAYLRDLFYSAAKPARYQLPQRPFPGLNSSQERAVNNILSAKDVAVVHGPPGTGKTTTLVESIYEKLMKESQVLVCAQSNMATDWICERLIDRGISVLRMGNPARVNDKMLAYTYERRFEAHPDYPQLWAIRRAIRALKGGSVRRTEDLHQKRERLNSRATALEIRIRADLLDQARVVACTLTGAASRTMEGLKFGTLFIDEAAQAMEPACWIALKRASTVVLAGDHCQLPPTIKSLAAMKGGLGKTLMERIVERKPETVTLLTTQYRMNESIMRFPNLWFYGGQIVSAPQVKHRGILDYDVPIVWLKAVEEDASRAGKPAREAFVGDTFGRINKGEAAYTVDVLRQYLEKIGRKRVEEERIDVGVISPYRAQVQYLRKLIRRDAFFKPYRNSISIDTVDGFQGQERDVIIISLVRSNDAGEIGFLADLRRMNVAITRARMKLIVIGNAATLARHRFYREFYTYVKSLQKEIKEAPQRGETTKEYA